ncbi:Serine/threonine-protein kinase PknK [compost metagenome]
MSLSQDDSQLETFCLSLIGALQQVGVSLEENLLPLNEEAGSDVMHMMSSLLINTLARTSGEFYLMLDDLQQARDPRITQLLQGLIEGAPHNLHIALASRQMPGLLLGRLRAMGELCEVEGAELAFDFHESHDFLKTHLDSAIDVDTAHALHDQADGWPIGLQLLSISRKANPRRRGGSINPQASSQGLEEYLAEDVIADLPAGLLDFLQKISILRRFNAPLAAHVTGVSEAEAMIEAIESRNLFLQSVDAPGDYQWLRLHPMFNEFLAKRLVASGTDVRLLHRRATEWFERAGLVAETMRHALLAEDFDLLVELLHRSQPSYKSVSHLGQFIRWLDNVPLLLLTQHPDLLIMGIWSCLLTSRTARAESWLAALVDAQLTPQWQDQVALLRATLAIQHDDMAEAHALLEPLMGTTLENPFLAQVCACLTVSALSSLGRYAEARRYFNSPAGRCLRSSSYEMALIGAASMAQMALFEGNVLEAERSCSTVLAQAEQVHGRRSVSACNCAAILGEAYYELDRIDEAREVLANRQDILRFAVPEYRISSALSHARLQLLQESSRSALEYLSRQEEQFRDLGLHRGVAAMLAERLRILLRSGDWRQAEVIQAALEDLPRETLEPTPAQAEVAVLTALSKARLALARQQPELALRALSEIEGPAREYARSGWRLKAEILRTLVLDMLGREEESLERAQSVLAGAYRMGMLRTLLDEGEPLRRLLTRLEIPADKELAAYLQELTRRQPVQTEQDEVEPQVGGAETKEPLLTRRELEILELLEQSMSNKRIALALNLSLQTVKWNLRNIFSKLGVSSRYEAIIIARKRVPRGS